MACIILVSGCGSGGLSQSSAASSASIVAPTSPPPTLGVPEPRSAAAIAYDGISKRILLFGGASAAGQSVDLGDTWLWGGNGWSPGSAQPGPSARSGALAVYDPIRRRVVLFGGQTGMHRVRLADTWSWNGATWVLQNPSQAPQQLPAGTGNLSFDGARAEVVLFGNTGISKSPTQGPATFTWVWTGSDWMQKDALLSPPFRFASAMAYDGASKEVVLYGGIQGETPNSTLGDTWTWNGSKWQQAAEASSSSPQPGAAYAAYDEHTNKLWLLTTDGGMWSWSNSMWTLNGSYAVVAHRYGATMLFDQAIGKIVLVGGTVVSRDPTWTGTIKNDLWAWDGTTWSQIG
jgi:hypothetical protein